MPVTNYIWDVETDSYLMETDGSNVTQAVYTNEPVYFGNLVSQRRGSTTSYCHFDALGSTRQLSNSVHTVTDTFLYGAWGIGIGATGSDLQFRFVGNRGYLFDVELEQYYIRARDYVPPLARWNSCDPIWAANAFVAYDNNPISFVDPAGLGVFPSTWSRGGDDERLTYETARIYIEVISDESQCDETFCGCTGNVSFKFHYHAKVGGAMLSGPGPNFGLCHGTPSKFTQFTGAPIKPVRNAQGYRYFYELKASIPLESIPCAGGAKDTIVAVSDRNYCDNPYGNPATRRIAEEVSIRMFVKECGRTFARATILELATGGGFPTFHVVRSPIRQRLTCGQTCHRSVD